jgi:hypothetical protein
MNTKTLKKYVKIQFIIVTFEKKYHSQAIRFQLKMRQFLTEQENLIKIIKKK